jgi:prolyl 4-hydroxylase
MTAVGSAAARLQRVAECDAAGRTDDALTELARGTSAGEAPSARALGIRLLTGERAPLLPDQGLRFLGEACDAGLPEAGARAAALLALGVRNAADWRLGLAWLARSAAGGWEPARRQLLALCADRALAAEAASATAADWHGIAGRVPLDDWRRSPPAVIRSPDPSVSTFPGFVPAALCEVLIGFAAGRLEPARIYDAVNRRDVVDAHRSNTVATFDVDAVEFAQVLLQARMAAACGVSERTMEPPTILHYAPGERIQEHYDFVNPQAVPDYAGEIARNGQRLITFIVYLNDDYAGGETAFPKLGLSHKGARGEGICFVNALPDMAPDLRTLHAGRPTTRGDKWIVTQFIRNRPMR